MKRVWVARVAGFGIFNSIFDFLKISCSDLNFKKTATLATQSSITEKIHEGGENYRESTTTGRRYGLYTSPVLSDVLNANITIYNSQGTVPPPPPHTRGQKSRPLGFGSAGY
jgi:hypothetical protein